LIAAASALAQLPAAKLQKIEQLISSEMARASVPGVSLAIATDGKIQWAGGFGMADLENFVPMTANTRVRLASISKTITAVAVMQLVEKGKIDLDAPIRRYVPEFPEQQWPVTVRQVMTHTAGIRAYRGTEMNSTTHYTDARSPMLVFSKDPVEFEPGTKYSYSTYGYTVLGAALETAAGQSMVDYFREHIFIPAGMDTIRDDSVHAIIPHRARGYQLRPNGVVENCELSDTSNKIAGGGLISTASDLVKFALALHGGKLLKRETMDQMFSAAVLRDGTKAPYGLGFELREENGIRIVGHTGGQRGTQTYLVTIPSKGIAFAYMMNLEASTALMPIARGLRAILLEP